MAFLQIKSTNPNFSFVLKKNPSSPMLIKQVRQGTAFGYYSKNKENEYNVFFRDNTDEASFSEEFTYLNSSQYSSAQFILTAISDFFSSNLKKQDEKDVKGFTNSLFINSLDIKHIKLIESLEIYFPKISFNYQDKGFKKISLTIETKESLHYLINAAALIALFNIFTKYDFIDEGLTEKYLNSILVVDAHYFIRYMFKKNFFSNKKFKQLKEKLEQSTNWDMKLTLGDNMLSRRHFVEDNLNFTNTIVDVGCGEGYYLPLAKKVEEYTAIDVNPKELEKAKRKAKKKGLENISFLKSIKDLKTNKPTDFIFIEVMEHMPLKEAKKIIKTITNDNNFNSLLISTPNKDFNKYYAVDGFRHDDHHYEMTKTEFQTFCQESFAGLQYKIIDIGDSVNGETPTQGVKVWK